MKELEKLLNYQGKVHPACYLYWSEKCDGWKNHNTKMCMKGEYLSCDIYINFLKENLNEKKN